MTSVRELLTKIPDEAVNVVIHFLYPRPLFGGYSVVRLDPEKEFVGPKLIYTKREMGIFETYSVSLGKQVVVKTSSRIEAETEFASYIDRIWEYTGLANLPRLYMVLVSGPPKFLLRNLGKMRKDLEIQTQELSRLEKSFNSQLPGIEKKRKEGKLEPSELDEFKKFRTRVLEAREKLGEAKFALERYPKFRNSFEYDKPYNYLVMEKLGDNVTKKYRSILTSKPEESAEVFTYLLFQVLLILIVFDDYHLQHNDFADRNILTQIVPEETEFLSYCPADSRGNCLGEYLIPTSKVGHSLLKITDFGDVVFIQDRCVTPRNAVLFGLENLWKYVSNQKELIPIREALLKCKFKNLRDLLSSEVFKKYLRR